MWRAAINYHLLASSPQHGNSGAKLGSCSVRTEEMVSLALTASADAGGACHSRSQLGGAQVLQGLGTPEAAPLQSGRGRKLDAARRVRRDLRACMRSSFWSMLWIQNRASPPHGQHVQRGLRLRSPGALPGCTGGSCGWAHAAGAGLRRVPGPFDYPSQTRLHAEMPVGNQAGSLRRGAVMSP